MQTRKIIFAFVAVGLIVAGISSAALAAGPGGERDHGWGSVDKKVEKMSERLELSDAQAEKIRAILEGKKADIKALKAEPGDRESKRKQMRAIRQSARAEIAAVLTDEQLEKAEALRSAHRLKRERARGGKRMLQRMTKKLDLTETQQTEVTAIAKAARRDVRRIVRDEFGGDRKAARSAVRERRAKMLADIRALLTPEQAEKFAKFEERMEKRAER